MTARPVLVLNGPNLGRLGVREPEIYGHTTHAELADLCARWGAELGLAVEVRQTDSEAELVGWLHEAAESGMPVVLNAAAFTHLLLRLARRPGTGVERHGRGAPVQPGCP